MTKNRKNYFVWIFSIPILLISITVSSQNVLVGILEHKQLGWPDKGLNERDKVEFSPYARLLFKKCQDSWCHINDNVKFNGSWNVLFDMKNIGTIEIGEIIDESSDYMQKLHTIVDKEIPVIGKPSTTFSSSWIGEKSYRPLVISNHNNYRDPLKWKRSDFPDKFYSVLIDKAIIKIKELNEYLPLKVDSEFIEQEHLVVKQDCYRSLNNDYLLHIEFSNKCFEYIEPMYYDRIHFWYFVKSNDEIRYLGSQMKLIDAADYDLDGKSEVIFSFTGYNKDGYILYFNEFSNKITFDWEYH